MRMLSKSEDARNGLAALFVSVMAAVAGVSGSVDCCRKSCRSCEQYYPCLVITWLLLQCFCPLILFACTGVITVVAGIEKSPEGGCSSRKSQKQSEVLCGADLSRSGTPKLKRPCSPTSLALPDSKPLNRQIFCDKLLTSEHEKTRHKPCPQPLFKTTDTQKP